jgi:transcriptional regulator with XRE-family HTH domain
MANEDWRIRLEQALKDSGRSGNAVSVEAGCAPNYLHGVLSKNKEPTLDRFLRICRALNVSPTYVLTGSRISPGTEAVVTALESYPEKRAAILALIGKGQPTG